MIKQTESSKYSIQMEDITSEKLKISKKMEEAGYTTGPKAISGLYQLRIKKMNLILQNLSLANYRKPIQHQIPYPTSYTTKVISFKIEWKAKVSFS